MRSNFEYNCHCGLILAMHYPSLTVLLLLAAYRATAYFESSDEDVVPWELQVCSQMYTNINQANSQCVNACMAKRQCRAGYCKIKDGLTRCKCGLCPMWNYRSFKTQTTVPWTIRTTLLLLLLFPTFSKEATAIAKLQPPRGILIIHNFPFNISWLARSGQNKSRK
ncbi:unnamed protein product [Cylicocyclus nassatus]|uniref:Uncharacterized protein n=1 Tax=Cylicocyclus nassatus TaxID=53992 RepID=A0AA36MFS2_CYLNA|nr:unnamed protein product [Cylicocyclus nassatus]